MTHTLHRQGVSGLDKEFILLSMAAQGFNDQGAAVKLKEVLSIVIKCGPVNFADDNHGGLFTGIDEEKVKDLMTDKAYIGAVFEGEDKVKKVLRLLKERDLGMSVTITGDRDRIFSILDDVGLEPNAIHLSLGIFGKKESLPSKQIMEICTMCGHGMVSPNKVNEILKKIKKGKINSTEGAKTLAKTCTCGIFNVNRAARILNSILT
jgi:hypothetical protein